MTSFPSWNQEPQSSFSVETSLRCPGSNLVICSGCRQTARMDRKGGMLLQYFTSSDSMIVFIFTYSVDATYLEASLLDLLFVVLTALWTIFV